MDYEIILKNILQEIHSEDTDTCKWGYLEIKYPIIAFGNNTNFNEP